MVVDLELDTWHMNKHSVSVPPPCLEERRQFKVAIHVPAGITREVLKIHFTRYLRGNHVRYIYGIVLKYTVNTGESVFFLVVGGRRVFKFRVWCACLSLYSLLHSSRPFLPPCACAFSCSVQRHGPWLCAYRQVRNVIEDSEWIPW